MILIMFIILFRSILNNKARSSDIIEKKNSSVNQFPSKANEERKIKFLNNKKFNDLGEFLFFDNPSLFKFNDVLLNLDNIHDFDMLSRNARTFGIEIIEELPSLNSLRVKILKPNKFAIETGSLDGKISLERNVGFDLPEFPDERILEQEEPFRGSAMEWIGANKNRKDRGTGVKVAILDSGVDSSHPALEGLKISHFSMLPEDSDLTHGHGTGIASIIAGQKDELLGVAPSCEIVSIRVLDEMGKGDAFTVARGIVKAVDEGVDIINLSLGGINPSAVLESSIKYAREKNVVLVSSAGNEGGEGLAYPARYSEVVGVASVDANSRVSSFSNYGTGVDIAAPGVGVLSAWSSQEQVLFSGTSIATAFVTGAIASEISRVRSNDSNNVMDALYNNADETEEPGVDKWSGKGILNLRRVEQRNEKGIYDAAIVGYYFDPIHISSEGTKPFLVTVQNQGTEWIQRTSLSVQYKGLNKNFLIGNLEPGEVRSETLYFDADKGSSLSVNSEVSIIGKEDSYLKNNKRKSLLTLP
jgi:hypothetical protein